MTIIQYTNQPNLIHPQDTIRNVGRLQSDQMYNIIYQSPVQRYSLFLCPNQTPLTHLINQQTQDTTPSAVDINVECIQQLSDSPFINPSFNDSYSNISYPHFNDIDTYTFSYREGQKVLVHILQLLKTSESYCKSFQRRGITQETAADGSHFHFLHSYRS